MRFIKLLKEPKKIDLSFVYNLKAEIGVIAKQFGISLFYIYGSLASGRMQSLSDVDIAIGCGGNRELETEEYLKLLSYIQDLLGREDIDLVELKKAPPLLKMRILQQGKLIYFKDYESLLEFRKLAISSYLRTLYLRKDFFRYVRSAVLKEDG